jgi:chemotaxis-related protein WspD
VRSEKCWKIEGVWGHKRPRCSELDRVIHCRNCEIFVQAGRRLLDHEIDEKYQQEWTDIIAAPKEEEVAGTFSVVIFRIGKEWLALKTQVFAEIIESAKFHTLPLRKSRILLGVINVHGEIQLCVSLQTLLGIEAEDRKHRQLPRRLMVINDGSDQWVFPVDEVYGIYPLHPVVLENIPVMLGKSPSAYSRGIFRWKKKDTDKMLTDVAFLDDERLLYGLARNIKG